MTKLRIFRAVSLVVAIVAALMLLSYAVWSTPWFGEKDPSFILGLWIAIALANAMASHKKIKNGPIQTSQRKTGSRLSSGDSSPSETPPSLGPRG